MHFTFLGSACAKDKHCIETCVLHIQNEAELKKLNVMVFISTLKKQMKMYGDIFFLQKHTLRRNGSI